MMDKDEKDEKKPSSLAEAIEMDRQRIMSADDPILSWLAGNDPKYENTTLGTLLTTQYLATVPTERTQKAFLTNTDALKPFLGRLNDLQIKHECSQDDINELKGTLDQIKVVFLDQGLDKPLGYHFLKKEIDHLQKRFDDFEVQTNNRFDRIESHYKWFYSLMFTTIIGFVGVIITVLTK